MRWNALSLFLVFSLTDIILGTPDVLLMASMPEVSDEGQFYPEVQFNLDFESKEKHGSKTLQVTEDDSDGDGLDAAERG